MLSEHRFLDSMVDCVNIAASRLRCGRKQQLTAFVKTIIDDDGEGVIMRKPDSLYENGRSKSVIKLKVLRFLWILRMLKLILGFSRRSRSYGDWFRELRRRNIPASPIVFSWYNLGSWAHFYLQTGWNNIFSSSSWWTRLSYSPHWRHCDVQLRKLFQDLCAD